MLPTFKNTFKRMWEEIEGQDLVEYALLIIMVSLLAVVSMRNLASGISNAYAKAATQLNTATGGGGGNNGGNNGNNGGNNGNNGGNNGNNGGNNGNNGGNKGNNGNGNDGNGNGNNGNGNGNGNGNNFKLQKLPSFVGSTPGAGGRVL